MPHPQLTSSRTRVAAASSPQEWDDGKRVVGELIQWLASTVKLDARAQQHDSNEELDSLADFYRAPAGQLLLGYVDGVARGSAGVHLMSKETAELRRVWVSPEWRGYGLASELLQTALTVARDLGAREIWLETVSGHMDTAIGMYLRAGFRPVPHYTSLSQSLPNVLSLGRAL